MLRRFVGLVLVALLCAGPAAGQMTPGISNGMLAGGAKPFTLTFIASTNDVANDSSYTFTDHAIGEAAGDRLVIVLACARDDGGGSPTISGLTIGGAAATQIVTVGSANNTCQLWQLVVTSGTTATIFFNTSVTTERANVSVYTLKGYVSATADDTVSLDADPATTTAVTVQAGGAIIGGGYSNGTGAFTTTGMTEDADQVIETGRVVAGSLLSATTQNPTMTFDHGAATTVVWASWH